MTDSPRRVMLAIGVLFVIIGGASIAVANMPDLQEWIAARTTTQTATEYARPSTVEDVRHVSWFGGVLFLFLAAVFFAVSRIPVSTDDSQDELVRRALADSKWNLDDNTTVTTFTTTSGSGDDVARLVRDALAGTPTPRGGHGGDSIDAQLAQLSRLHESGALTAEEFAAAKKQLLGL